MGFLQYQDRRNGIVCPNVQKISSGPKLFPFQASKNLKFIDAILNTPSIELCMKNALFKGLLEDVETLESKRICSPFNKKDADRVGLINQQKKISAEFEIFCDEVEKEKRIDLNKYFNYMPKVQKIISENKQKILNDCKCSICATYCLTAKKTTADKSEAISFVEIFQKMNYQKKVCLNCYLEKFVRPNIKQFK